MITVTLRFSRTKNAIPRSFQAKEWPDGNIMMSAVALFNDSAQVPSSIFLADGVLRQSLIPKSEPRTGAG